MKMKDFLFFYILYSNVIPMLFKFYITNVFNTVHFIFTNIFKMFIFWRWNKSITWKNINLCYICVSSHFLNEPYTYIYYAIYQTICQEFFLKTQQTNTQHNIFRCNVSIECFIPFFIIIHTTQEIFVIFFVHFFRNYNPYIRYMYISIL